MEKELKFVAFAEEVSYKSSVYCFKSTKNDGS